jgi:hypothetical protein
MLMQNIGLNDQERGDVHDAANPPGATEVMVSRLGLGMAALGRPGYINLGHGRDLGAPRDVPSMAANARRVLDAALAAGVRYFRCDAAPSYALGETFLAAGSKSAPFHVLAVADTDGIPSMAGNSKGQSGHKKAFRPSTVSRGSAGSLRGGYMH